MKSSTKNGSIVELKIHWIHVHLKDSCWKAPSGKTLPLEDAFTEKTEFSTLGVGEGWSMGSDAADGW